VTTPSAADAGEHLRDYLADVEAVLFDLDHTVLDTGTAFDRAIRLTLLPQLRERAGSAGAGIAEETVLALWHADPEGHYRRFTRGETTHHGQRLSPMPST
jgi:putative hydrolase of the HAD superfamily